MKFKLRYGRSNFGRLDNGLRRSNYALLGSSQHCLRHSRVDPLTMWRKRCLSQKQQMSPLAHIGLSRFGRLLGRRKSGHCNPAEFKSNHSIPIGALKGLCEPKHPSGLRETAWCFGTTPWWADFNVLENGNAGGKRVKTATLILMVMAVPESTWN